MSKRAAIYPSNRPNKPHRSYDRRTNSGTPVQSAREPRHLPLVLKIPRETSRPIVLRARHLPGLALAVVLFQLDWGGLYCIGLDLSVGANSIQRERVVIEETRCMTGRRALSVSLNVQAIGATGLSSRVDDKTSHATQSNATHRDATHRNATHRNNKRSACCCDCHSSACPGKAAHRRVYRRAVSDGGQQGVDPVSRRPAGGGQDLPRALHCGRLEQEVSRSCCWWCCCSCRVCHGVAAWSRT